MEQKIDYNIDEIIFYVKEENEAIDFIYNLCIPLISYEVNKFKRLVVSFDLDINDLIQEANISLIKAINNYNASIKIKFTTFATIVIKRDLFNYIKRYGYLKKEFSFKYFSEHNFSELFLEKFIKNELEDPLTKIVEYENITLLLNKFETLEEYEKEIVFYLLNGFSKKEIAKFLQKSTSQIYYYIKKIKKTLVL